MRHVFSALLVALALTSASRACLADSNPDSAAQSTADAAREKEAQSLHWIKGPQKVQLFDNSALQIPVGYIFLNPADTAKLDEIQRNLGGPNQYFLAPADGHWEAFFSFSDDGYVKDNEKIDADSILKNIQNSTQEGNKVRRERGWDEMEVTGWQTAPHYDTQSNHLEWAIQGRNVRTNSQVINFNTRILGRGGVMSVVLAAAPQAMTTSISEFKSTLQGFEYLPGQRYAEYKPGDKIAKYGLAALITGGAAAVAVKTGLWKVILTALVASWKIIAAAVVAGFAGIRNFFKRKTL